MPARARVVHLQNSAVKVMHYLGNDEETDTMRFVYITYCMGAVLIVK